VKLVDKIQIKKLKDLQPFERNPKIHTTEQVAQIAASIVEFGFNNPVLIDSENKVWAGHGRILAAKDLKIAEVPTINLDHIPVARRKAYLLADNRLGEGQPYDETLLKSIMDELKTDGFDLNLTGFSKEEIDGLMGDLEIELNDGVGGTHGGAMRNPGKNMIIGINKYTFTIKDKGDSDRIMEFCDFMAANEDKKTEVNLKLQEKLIEVINDILHS